MARVPHPLRRSRGPWLVLALLGVLISGLVPQGFMPERQDNGGLVLTLCTGHGPVAIQSSGAPAKAPAEKKPAPACAFAGHGATAGPPMLATVAAALAPPPAPLTAAFAPALRPGLGLAAPPPPAIGPPTQA
jgi:hypothetical protein